jgi:hypothetical protein
MQRVTINVNGASYPLAQNQDLDRSDIVAGVRSGGDFVKVIVYGNRELAILVSPGLSLTFDTQEVRAQFPLTTAVRLVDRARCAQHCPY